MKDKYYIINLIKKLISDFDKYLVCFTDKDIEIKREMFNTLYDMFKITYEANTTYDINKRTDIIDKIIAYIKYLDYIVMIIIIY